ncbi:hypothetical protein [Bradyrhizobium valentinum]|uniref:Uncharacterized protein n=1 Tax=Bradyrhizobium valentinum TaxID=1518501 RepID=A0A0R3L5L5_9BRAD|nr:hypothetical protein CP49_04455 [Bradyrhizobium valentinum]
MKKPAAVSGAGIYDIGDDANVPLICPTRQVAKANQIQHSGIETKSSGRGRRNLRPNRAQGGYPMFFLAAVLTILSGLFYAASLMRSARWVSRCANMAARSLRQSAARAGSCSVGCVLGRIRQRALTRSLRSRRISVMMPSCR